MSGFFPATEVASGLNPRGESPINFGPELPPNHSSYSPRRPPPPGARGAYGAHCVGRGRGGLAPRPKRTVASSDEPMRKDHHQNVITWFSDRGSKIGTYVVC